MISVTFLFLQILSLKAIDNTLISRFRVLESLRGLLPYRNQRDVKLKHIKAFVEVSKEHGVPTFLFHPLVFHLTTTNFDQIHNQQDGCEVFCGNQYFVFGVINSEWQKGQSHPLSTLIYQFRTDLQTHSFHIVCRKVPEPWFDSSKDFMDIKSVVSSCSVTLADTVIELVIFYERTSYLWHGPLQGDTAAKSLQYSAAYNRFFIEKKVIDGIPINVPTDPEKLASERNQTRFTGCNITNVQQYYSKYGRDISPDAVLFKKKALEVLSTAISALDRLGVRFWLSSGTCLGWYRQCDIIPHSKDVDIGIWIKDYNSLLISEFEKAGLFLKHKFGRIDDSFELSFRTEEDYVKLDIFFFYEEKDYMWNGGTQAKTGKKFKYIFPKFTLCWTEFLKMKVRIPCETESYVMANYGKNWQVPIKEWNWKESPPNVRENGQWNAKDWGEVIQLF
ncbi:hypothetical protein ACROYT_G043718 [Oculina patagonica]